MSATADTGKAEYLGFLTKVGNSCPLSDAVLIIWAVTFTSVVGWRLTRQLALPPR